MTAWCSHDGQPQQPLTDGGRCPCRGCTSGTHGDYVRLLHAAQDDTDPQRKQQAHSLLSAFGPYTGSTGADGSCPGDTLATPALRHLYPADPPDSRQQ